MALISCSCLNCIVWFTDKNVQEEKENAALCQDLVELSPDSINRIPDHTIGGLIEDFIKQAGESYRTIKKTITYNEFVRFFGVGNWQFELCMICNVIILCRHSTESYYCPNNSLLTNEREIKEYKKHDYYSETYNLLLDDKTLKYELASNPAQRANYNSQVDKLKLKMELSLDARLVDIKTKIANFQKLLEDQYQKFSEKTHREYEFLVTRLQSVPNTVSPNTVRDRNILQNAVAIKSSATKEPEAMSIETGPVLPVPSINMDVQNAPKLRGILKNRSESVPAPNYNDDEIFAMDDFERVSPRPYGAPNVDDIDDVDDDGDDLEVSGHPSKSLSIIKKNSNESSVARSLPISVPFTNFKRQSGDDEAEECDTVNIATSIQALAKSVHGDGYELPPPRYRRDNPY